MLDFQLLLDNKNIQAFLRMIRVGEGTDNVNGYHTLFGGELFDSFAEHPNKTIEFSLKGKKLTSTAAGAYQFLYRTWKEISTAYKLPDFSPENQDKGAIILLHRRKAIDDILTGRIKEAIVKCNKEWASLPGAPYGQPTKTFEQALKYYTEAGGEFTAVTNQGEQKVAPFIIPAVTALMEAAPSLIRIFGDSPQAEKNAKAAEIVVTAAKEATGSVNEQDLIQKLETKDPVILEQVNQAVKSVWYEISVDTGGVEKAREASATSQGFWKQPAIWVTAALMPLVYITVMSVLGLMGPGNFTEETKVMVITAIVSGVLSGITGFWLGTSFSSSRKTELLGK